MSPGDNKVSTSFMTRNYLTKQFFMITLQNFGVYTTDSSAFVSLSLRSQTKCEIVSIKNNAKLEIKVTDMNRCKISDAAVHRVHECSCDSKVNFMVVIITALCKICFHPPQVVNDFYFLVVFQSHV